MAYLHEEIDFSEIEPSTSRELMQPGWQKAEIVESDVKPTKKASAAQEYNETSNPNFNDKALHLTFRIIDGEHKGRNVWGSYNYIHNSATAQEIARKEVAAIRQAIGIPKDRSFRDSNELHNRPLMIFVDVEKSEGYKPKNVITGYKAIEASATTPAPATAAPATPAWNRQ